MNTPTYDIFSGRFGPGACWIEAVDGLEAAVEKMKARANKAPGSYFVFSLQSNEVVATVDTTVDTPARPELESQSN